MADENVKVGASPAFPPTEEKPNLSTIGSAKPTTTGPENGTIGSASSTVANLSEVLPDSTE
jgi:hypothetical protein